MILDKIYYDYFPYTGACYAGTENMSNVYRKYMEIALNKMLINNSEIIKTKDNKNKNKR